MFVRTILFALALMTLTHVAHAAECADWGSCNTTLTLNSTPDVDFPNHVFDVETDHFAIFLDPSSPGTASIDPARYQIMQDQLECAYRYFVCERGLTYAHTEKVQIYVGPLARAAPSESYIEIAEWALGNSPAYESKAYNQPVHEFFHRVAFSSGAFSIYQSLGEGLATLAEQMVSRETYLKSLQDAIGGRAASITQPQDDFSHSKNIFLRYFMEQMAGRAIGETVDEDWAVGDLVGPLLGWMQTLYNQNLDVILPHLLESEGVPGVTLAATYDEMIDNYQTMRYGFDKVQLKSSCVEGRITYPQVKYSYRNSLDLMNVATLNPISAGSVLGRGDSLYASNVNVDYGGITPILGFREYLAAEYHVFDLDPGVSQLLIERGQTDVNIRFQLIYNRSDGCIIPHQVLENGLMREVVTLPRGTAIDEYVLVAYSTSALAADNGRVFEVTVTPQ